MKITVFIILFFVLVGSALAGDDDADLLAGSDTVIFIQNFYSGLVTVETPETLGAAVLIFNDSIIPLNLQPQMIMGYDYLIDSTTHINFYSLSNQVFLEGPLLSFTGEGILTDVDAADSAGGMLTSLIEVITDVNDDEPEQLPGDFKLAQNYPNPFNAGTNIDFNLEKRAEVVLEVIDITGKKINTVYRGTLGAGEYSFAWQAVDDRGRELPSGVYFYRLKTDESSVSRKMLLLK